MTKPQKPSIVTHPPILLRVGIVLFAISAVIANTSPQNANETPYDKALPVVLIASFLLMGIGGVQFIIKNERLRLNSTDDRIRSIYIYLVLTLVAIFVIFALISTVFNL
jgi:SNF family Na+-dependent transporter